MNCTLAAQRVHRDGAGWQQQATPGGSAGASEAQDA
jgi:hypothetical protein